MSIYISVNQQTTGPFEENAVVAWLRSGQLSPDVLAWREGASVWQPLGNLFPVPAQSTATAGAQPSGYPMLSHPQSISTQKRTCVKCGQQEGDVYSFHFGNKTSQSSYRRGNRIITTTSFAVAGRIDGVLCNECIRQRRVLKLVVFGLMTVAGVVLWPAGPLVARLFPPFICGGLIIAIIFALIGLCGLLANAFRSRATHAENLLIALKKGELQKQGFKTFWNTQSFSQMRRR